MTDALARGRGKSKNIKTIDFFCVKEIVDRRSPIHFRHREFFERVDLGELG
jgi:hypothetical protein